MKKYLSSRRLGIFLCMVLALVCLSYGCGGGARDIILVESRIIYASGDTDSTGKIYFTSQSEPLVIIEAKEGGTLPESSSLTLKERDLEASEVGDYGNVSTKAYTLTGTVEKGGVIRPLSETMKPITITIPNRFSSEYTEFWLGFKSTDELVWQYQKIPESGESIVTSARLNLAPTEFVIKTYRLNYVFTIFAVKPEDLIKERVESFSLAAEPLKYEYVASDGVALFCDDLKISSFITANDAYVFTNPQVVHELTFISNSNQGSDFCIDGKKAQEYIFQMPEESDKYVHKFTIDSYEPDNCDISGILATFSFVLNIKDKELDIFPDSFKVKTTVTTHKNTLFTFEEAFLRRKNIPVEPDYCDVVMIEPNPCENVATNTVIVLSSDKEILWEEDYASYIKIYDEDDTIASATCSISADKKEITITPLDSLRYETTYTVAIRKGIPVNESNWALGSGTFEFVTIPASFTMASISVTDDSLYKGYYKTCPKFVIDFGMPVANPIEAENVISVMTGSISVPFILAFKSDNKTAVLSFNEDLKPNVRYNVSMQKPVKSIENQDIAQFSVINFTTLPDVSVDFAIPVDRMNAGIDTSIALNFSPAIDWEDSHKGLISVMNYDDMPVDFNVAYDSTTGQLSITPLAWLQFNMNYTIGIEAGLMNHESNQKLETCRFAMKTNNKIPGTDLEPEHLVASISIAPEDYIDAAAPIPVINLGARFIVDFKDTPRDLRKAENAVKIYSNYEEATKLSADWSEDKTKLTFTISANMASETIRVAFIGDVFDSRNVKIEPFDELRFETTAFAGDGTEERPYEVFLPVQLDLVRKNMTAHYKQMGDIDLTNYSSVVTSGYDSAGFEPIGIMNELTGEMIAFEGTYDGQGYKIKGFWQNLASGNMVTGLFGLITGEACIRNVHLDNPEGCISGYYYMGSICGAAMGGKILNCSNNITIEAKSIAIIGGIVSYLADFDCIVDGCVNSGKILGRNMTEVAGGIVAGAISMENFSITNCINTGEISNDLGYSAGIICICESNMTASITNCINTAEVSGGISAGIINMCDNNTAASIKNCKNTGDIYSKQSCSAGIGGALEFCEIEACVNTGNIFGNELASGILGEGYYAQIDKSYNSGNIVSEGTSSGLFDNLKNCEISNCYNVASVEGKEAYGLWRILDYSNISNCYVECSIQVKDHESDETDARLKSGVLGNYVDYSSIKDCFATKNTVLNNISDVASTEFFPSDCQSYIDYCENTYILENGYSNEIGATAWTTESTWTDSLIWNLSTSKLPELVMGTE